MKVKEILNKCFLVDVELYTSNDCEHPIIPATSDYEQFIEYEDRDVTEITAVMKENYTKFDLTNAILILTI